MLEQLYFKNVIERLMQNFRHYFCNGMVLQEDGSWDCKNTRRQFLFLVRFFFAAKKKNEHHSIKTKKKAIFDSVLFIVPFIETTHKSFPTISQ